MKTNWLERARHEISKSTNPVTANSAERSVTAAMAVLDPGEFENSNASIGSNGSALLAELRKIPAANETIVPMIQKDEAAILAWLVHIDETDPAALAEVMNKCAEDIKERTFFLKLALEVPYPVAIADDRRHCDQCANLTERGLCLAARRGEINATRIHTPVRDLPQRCVGYLPKASDMDQRPGRERWPGLIY